MKFLNLKQFRKDKGLNQKKLVALTGLPQSTISYIENGYQEVREKQLAVLRRVFPEDDLSKYIYESDSYPSLSQSKINKEESNQTFPGDWSKPNPVDRVEGLEILMKMGRVSISFDGNIVLDRNDGTYFNIGYYVINPDLFGESDLIDHLTQKGWFNDGLYEDFKRCYLIACCLVGKRPVKQVKVDD